MKRMSEVFELPLRCQDKECGTVGSVYDANGDIAMQAQSPILYSAPACAAARNERSSLAAHAINHVDALADNLEEALLQIGYLHKKFGGTGSGNAVLSRGNSALNAYRGAK